MCNCLDKQVYEYDEQPLFCLFYCGIHDEVTDGFGISLEEINIIQEEAFL